VIPEAYSADNPARLSPSDPARLRLKPLGFVDTGTLDEISARSINSGGLTMEVCALCGKQAQLELSHIIPKFVFDYIKKTSATGRFRMPLDNPNIPKQDGEKKKLLCGDCEDKFSEQERLFATNLFHQFQRDDTQEFEYDKWLSYFITSVNWRNLHEDIEWFQRDRTISDEKLKILITSEQVMKEYLLGTRDNLGEIENHIFFFDRIKETDNKEIIQNGPHVFFRRSVFGYTYITHDPFGIYVYSNLAGILICTIIKATDADNWVNTKVDINHGEIQMPQNITSPLMNEIFEYMLECRQSKMSDGQKEKLIEKIKSNPEKLLNSKFIEFWKYDKDLEGK